MGVTLPKPMSAKIRSRIETARKENAKKKIITCQPPCLFIATASIPSSSPPRPTVVGHAASTSGVSTDMVNHGSFVLKFLE